jgi:predicted Fe-Mo cluster-binding NifX family protein
MKLCFPVEEDCGMSSPVYNHFGSAPMFIIIDTLSNSLSTINNRDQHHEHGACNPIMALDNNKVDAIIVGGIGRGALVRLNQSGIRVFQAAGVDMQGNLSLLMAGQLPEYTLQQCCRGHSEGGGCAH